MMFNRLKPTGILCASGPSHPLLDQTVGMEVLRSITCSPPSSPPTPPHRFRPPFLLLSVSLLFSGHLPPVGCERVDSVAECQVNVVRYPPKPYIGVQPIGSTHRLQDSKIDRSQVSPPILVRIWSHLLPETNRFWVGVRGCCYGFPTRDLPGDAQLCGV